MQFTDDNTKKTEEITNLGSCIFKLRLQVENSFPTS